MDALLLGTILAAVPTIIMGVRWAVRSAIRQAVEPLIAPLRYDLAKVRNFTHDHRHEHVQLIHALKRQGIAPPDGWPANVGL